MLSDTATIPLLRTEVNSVSTPAPALRSVKKLPKKIFQNPLTGQPKVIIISLNLQNAMIGISSGHSPAVQRGRIC